jgi:23S rRNA pseudouridine1911/1915/1917 synthase
MENTKTQDSREVLILAVAPADIAKRLDILATEKAGITRSHSQKLIRDGLILVNGKPESPGYKVKTSDMIEISMPGQSNSSLVPEALPLTVLFMDEYLAVVDKPAGMVVYPAAGHSGGTLMNALAYHARKLATIGGDLRPGVVHRLDKDTSGSMVVALDDGAYYNLIEQFRKRTIHRKYIALVSGPLKDDSGEIALAIGRSDSDRKKMSTRTKRGKEAVTRWKVLRRLNKATLVEARLGTGRTHQIRVHFAAIGHPVLGDGTYGKKTEVEIKGRKIHIPRQMLHAETLGFEHPHTGQLMEFSSPVPDDMKECIEKLSV